MDRSPSPDLTDIRNARTARAARGRFEDLPADISGDAGPAGGYALAEALDQLRVAREDLARAGSERAEGDRIRAELLAVLSHDFRTPLQAMFGYTELLERGVHGPMNEAQLRDLHRLQHSHQHLLGLVNRLLEYSRLDPPARRRPPAVEK